jgi:CRISPR-associated endonuclease/helicase Cas3
MAERKLGTADFAPFFEAVWGYAPFPWQCRLLERLAAGGEAERDPGRDNENWPDVLDLPTGAGKTSALDIALFHLALDAATGGRRRAPVRIAFIVDRRLIVDDAYERSRRLAHELERALAAPETARLEVLKVAQALRTLAGPSQPAVVVRRLRGGAPLEEDWAHTPVQPTILCSTVDQVGSRLLFRGYGLSDRMRPIHAGLLGSDCLLLLDEAHLSEPFRQTLRGIRGLRGHDTAPFGFALLTATPGAGDEERFGLVAEDRAHPVLSARLAAPKPARLVEIAGSQGVDAETRRVEEVAEAARAMVGSLAEGGIARSVVGVVLNRVARARAVFDRLRRDMEDAEVHLLIGPARAVERDRHASSLAAIRTGADAMRAGLERPFIIVATQTIEAGVDLDFDGLVTEAAALDALRQRFGRLNRAGRPIAPQAVILAHKEDIGARADDTVYGDRIAATWIALQRLAAGSGTVDFGIDALQYQVANAEAHALAAPVDDAPILMPAYAELWSQTSPIPNADPEAALFLHGVAKSPANVQIVWRGDIASSELSGVRGKAARNTLSDRLKTMPPRAGESVEVSLWAARAWLLESAAGENDLSDTVERQPEAAEARQAGRPAFRWAGEDSAHTGIVLPRELRNGDLVVVPAGYGGCDEWGWNRRSRDTVTDVADLALWPFRARRFAVRVTPELIVQGLQQERTMQAGSDGTGRPIDFKAIASRLAAALGEHSGDAPSVLLDAVRQLDLPSDMQGRLDALDQSKVRLAVEFPYGVDGEEQLRGVVFVAPRGVATGEVMEAAGIPATESDDSGSLADRPITLIEHSYDVRQWAERFCVTAGLDAKVAADVGLASFLHDAGKADPRFQAWLAGGDPYGPDSRGVLAKSGLRQLSREAWRRAGLPNQWRHEALSVRLALLHPEFAQAHDPALVLWLIGTHHGFGRPLFPHEDAKESETRQDLLKAFGVDRVLEPGAGPQSLAFDFGGLDWVQLFEDLKRRHGIWGLARLECFVRLADHRASEHGSGEVDVHLGEAAA